MDEMIFTVITSADIYSRMTINVGNKNDNALQFSGYLACFRKINTYSFKRQQERMSNLKKEMVCDKKVTHEKPEAALVQVSM